MSEAKTFYAWVRVGDGEPEPAAITGKKPNRKATTIGCPDTFDVDDPDSGCSILRCVTDNQSRRGYQSDRGWAVGQDIESDKRGRSWEAAIRSPLDPDAYPKNYEVGAEETAAREAAYQRAIKIKPHSYAGFGRRASTSPAQQAGRGSGWLG